MKTLLQYLLLRIFLFAFTTTTTLAEVVLDSNGDPVFNSGGSYYIVPALRGRGGGGLELAQTETETCPLTVVQSPLEISKGIPAIISSPIRIIYIDTSFPVNIEFTPSEPSTCLPSPAPWKVEQESQAVKISTEGKPFLGPFRIQKVDTDVYKLQYCVMDDSNQICDDLGISIDDDYNTRLVVKNGNPLLVNFVRASDANESARRSWNIMAA